jgi:hypothetical protein
VNKREEQLARKREQLEESKGLLDYYAYKVRTERWVIATLERQIRELEQKETA